MKVSMSITGNKAVIASLSRLSSEIQETVSEEVEATTYDIHADAVSNVRVNYGFLKNQITPAYNPATLTGEVEVKAGNKGAYIEFGTGAFVRIPKGLEQYAMEWYVNGLGRLPASPYLFPAFFAQTVKMMDRLRKRIAALTK